MKKHDLLLERINRIEQLVVTNALPLEERASLEPINENILHQPDDMPMLDEEIEITKMEKTDSKKMGRKRTHKIRKTNRKSVEGNIRNKIFFRKVESTLSFLL
ncbi:hypothetical protein ACSU6B_04210 [Neobacillus sp. C211]|uniref:hypothetical protein n=1 Tax=unclassified Neobacillus TaxID=2675272 RepID=UPI00397C4469